MDEFERFRDGDLNLEELEEEVKSGAASAAGWMAMRHLFLDLEEIMRDIRLLLVIFLIWAAAVSVFGLYWFQRLNAWQFASKLIGGG